jgi:hypothetical protein
MGKKVYANGREVAGKANSGKSIAALPDVCLSPPSPPAGPVPVPYPVTAEDADTTDGTKEVKVGGQPLMKKDQSKFKKCTGDEAATKSLGMGVVTHNITGGVLFVSWSMDVKIEGQNAVRHLDMMTHNHQGKTPGQTPPWPYTQGAAMSDGTDPCGDEKAAEDKACKDKKDPCEAAKKLNKPKPPVRPKKLATLAKKSPAYKKAVSAYKSTAKYKKWLTDTKRYYSNLARVAADDDCLRARRCKLSPWNPSKCCKGQTPHHLIEKTSFFETSVAAGKLKKGCDGYDPKTAPCICVEGNSQYVGTHGWMHTAQGYTMTQLLEKPVKRKDLSFKEARENAAQAVSAVFPESCCGAKCIEAQLAQGHKSPIGNDTQVKGAPTGRTKKENFEAVKAKVQERQKALGLKLKPTKPKVVGGH